MLAVGLRVDHTASAVEGGPGKCPEASTPGPADCRQSNFETRGLFGAGGDREGGATWGAAPGGGGKELPGSDPCKCLRRQQGLPPYRLPVMG